MDFDLTDEQRLIVESVKALIARECPAVRQREWDEGHVFPFEVWKKLGDQGWLGMPVPVEHGGAGASALDIVLFSEALSYGMTGLSAAFQRTACYGARLISQFGTDEQRQELLPGILSGDDMVAIALSEPEAGSDAASLRTRAVSVGGDFVISGQKIYISGADVAKTLVVVARTDPDAAPREGLTTFLVPADAPGIDIRPMEKLGNWTIATCEVFFDDVRVPHTAVVGGLNSAWNTSLSAGLEIERLVIGAHCTGSAQKALDLAIAHAGNRRQFGKTLDSFQLVQSKLVDMAVGVQSARLITYHAACLYDAGRDCRKEASMSKLCASEAWNRVAYDAMQIAGGSGYMMESDFQRHFRDARLYTIGAGTSEIQRLIISHELCRGRA